MSEKRITLSENDFKTLVRGKVVIRGEVRVILSDIGFHQMMSIIRRTSRNARKGIK